MVFFYQVFQLEKAQKYALFTWVILKNLQMFSYYWMVKNPWEVGRKNLTLESKRNVINAIDLLGQNPSTTDPNFQDIF